MMNTFVLYCSNYRWTVCCVMMYLCC